jgi:hypothetical protein
MLTIDTTSRSWTCVLRALLVAAIVASLPVHAGATTSREIVMAERGAPRGALQVDRGDRNLRIEICTKRCDYFVARRVESEDQVWDAVLLHQAFFDEGSASKSFRAKNSAHISSIMASYARQCTKYPQDASRATCILKYLAKRNRIDYAVVRYNDGNRCEIASELITAAQPTRMDKCERTKSRR